MNDESGIPIDVVVVPAVVRFAGSKGEQPPPWLQRVHRQDTPAFLAYVPRRGWDTARVTRGKKPHDVAAGLVAEVGQGLYGDGGIDVPNPEPVGFIEPAGRRTSLLLVYTVAGPVSATDLEPPAGRRWIDLHEGPNALPAPALVRDGVRDHWRQALEETTRGLDLLPRYFTMTQLLEVYRAVWKADLDWGNFEHWVTERNRGLLVSTASTEQVRAARDSMLHAIGGAAAAGLVKSGVGTSPASLAVPLYALAGPVSRAVTATAGAAAYQRTSRGRTPQWYTRAQTDSAHRLTDLFGPRPTW